MNPKPLILRTDNFNRVMPWIKRSVFFAIVLFLLLVYSVNGKDILVAILLITAAFFILFSLPIDEMAVDNTHLYRVRKSVVPLFTKVRMYELQEIASIRCEGAYTPGTEIMSFLSFGQLYQLTNYVHITFTDNSTIDFNVAIFKKDLDILSQKVKDLKKSAYK